MELWVGPIPLHRGREVMEGVVVPVGHPPFAESCTHPRGEQPTATTSTAHSFEPADVAAEDADLGVGMGVPWGDAEDLGEVAHRSPAVGRWVKRGDGIWSRRPMSRQRQRVLGHQGLVPRRVGR